MSLNSMLRRKKIKMTRKKYNAYIFKNINSSKIIIVKNIYKYFNYHFKA